MSCFGFERFCSSRSSNVDNTVSTPNSLMVLLKATPEISSVVGLNKITKILQSTRTEQDDELLVDRAVDDSQHGGIDHRLILEAFKSRQSGISKSDIGSEHHHNVASEIPCSHPELDLLLRNSSVHVRASKIQNQKSQEYLDLMENLRREEEEKKYYEMVPRPSFQDPVKASVSEVSSQISAIFNVLFSSLFTGLAVWFAAGMSNSVISWPSLRVALSLSASILVAVAEVVLYASYLEKVAAASTKEKMKVEIKHVKRSWALTFDTGPTDNHVSNRVSSEETESRGTSISQWRELAIER